jgi:hypothetical protein
MNGRPRVDETWMIVIGKTVHTSPYVLTMAAIANVFSLDIVET